MEKWRAQYYSLGPWEACDDFSGCSTLPSTQLSTWGPREMKCLPESA